MHNVSCVFRRPWCVHSPIFSLPPTHTPLWDKPKSTLPLNSKSSLFWLHENLSPLCFLYQLAQCQVLSKVLKHCRRVIFLSGSKAWTPLAWGNCRAHNVLRLLGLLIFPATPLGSFYCWVYLARHLTMYSFSSTRVQISSSFYQCGTSLSTIYHTTAIPLQVLLSALE